MADQNRGRTGLEVQGLPQVAVSSPAAGHGAQGGQREPRRPSGARALRNWRVRWRLLALIIVPTVAAIAFGAVRVEAARTTAASFARISQLAALGRDFTALTQSVADERDVTAGFLASQQAGDKAQAAALLGKLQQQYRATDSDLTAAAGLAGQVSSAASGNPQATRNDVASALQNLRVDLPDLRGFVHSQIDPLAMTTAYSQLLSPLLAFDDDIATGSSNPQLAQFASLLGSAAQMEDQASQQRALLYAALFQGQFQPGLLSTLTAAQTNQASSLASFQASGANVAAFLPASGSTPAGFSPTLTQVQQFSNIVQGAAVDDAQRIELAAVVAGQAGRQPDGGAGNAAEWFTDMTSTLQEMRSFAATELDAISSQAGTLQRGAVGSERLTGLIVLLVLLLVLIISVVVARSMILPLRRLRAGALDVANHRLPDMVRRLSESKEENPQGIQIAPIDVDSTDEIGEVARAFDRVHGEAVRLAAEEALLRANLNAMFVNLSRRSQTLIERQLGIIESLEQSEQDSSRLSSLFRLDHLATRMRRNSENLLVLAGHEAPRKWTQPVPLVDVLRAAVSEIERYERITMNVQPGLVIAGRAASDIVHLVAELAENATTFSRKETLVMITGQLLSSGGVLMEITDDGLGIAEQELAYANWRLDNPPVIDVAVSRRMGLFVVGRLAARHGVKVRLRPARGGGLSALIWVPEAVAEAEPAPSPGTGRRGGTGGWSAMISVPAGSGAPTAADAAWPLPAAPSAMAMTPAEVKAASRSRSVWFDTGNDEPAAAPAAAPLDPVASAARPLVQRVPGATLVAGAPTARPSAAPTGPVMAGGGQAAMAGVGGTGGPPRLPIYDSIESEWFRRGGQPVGQEEVPGPPWTSPADEGFRVAAQAASPAVGQATPAGLPKRVPSANLIPGAIRARAPESRGSQAPPAPAPRASRSPEAIRARMSAFQLRGRDGRSRAPQPPPGH